MTNIHKNIFVFILLTLATDWVPVRGQVTNNSDGRSWGALYDSLAKTVVGVQFPLFEAQVYGGGKISSETIRGKVLLASFWFEHCQPCIAKIEGYNELYDSLKSNPDFVFVAFTYEPEKEFDQIIKKYNIRFPVAHVSKEEIKRMKMVDIGYPAATIVNKDNKVVIYKCGGPWETKKASEYIRNNYYPLIQNLLAAQ